MLKKEKLPNGEKDMKDEPYTSQCRTYYRKDGRINYQLSYSFVVVLCLLATFCSAVQAESSTRGAFSFTGFSTGIGTRAMGMNGAFTAVSNDSSAAYWNPAGLTTSLYKELSFTRADLYGLDLITTNTLNMSTPDTGSGAMSLGWNRMQFEFESWYEDIFLISYAKCLYGLDKKGKQKEGFNLALGVTAKYLRQNSDLEIIPWTDKEEDTEVEESEEPDEVVPVICKSRGYGVDFGILAGLRAKDGRNRLSVGMVIQDTPTRISWNKDTEIQSDEYLPYRYKLGISAEPLPGLTAAVDIVGEKNISFKELHLGVEHWIFPAKNTFPVSEKNLAIRGGVAKQLSNSERITFAAGVGVRWASWQLDYAYLMDSDGLGDTKNRFSVSVRF
ncbi:hypothetical protein GF312_15455 [Candidatus Poribacteria bacterium]|nr:hypothetical protein [Candidatus Poribacteria bacterium]